MIKRRKTRSISIGSVKIGAEAPVSVQSMTKTDTRDVNATVSQIHLLYSAGCQIVRLAVPDMEAAKALREIKKQAPIPLIADIHFDWRLAIESILAGIDGLRINPGNIGARWKIKELIDLCKERSTPIRIGVNGGSLEKDILARYGHPTAEAIVESAERHIRILEEMGFEAYKVSLKASDVIKTIESYRIFSERYDCPLHIGISEAGPSFTGLIKSASGLGILLYQGIGDTMRVSLTTDPVEEVRTAITLLRALGLREQGPDIISCPTCGRCQVNVVNIAYQVEDFIRSINKPLKVAVMGCAVNGPGEAREADVGIACGKGEGFLFKKGKIIRRVKEEDLLKSLIEEINSI